jgi:hypothetical protein
MNCPQCNFENEDSAESCRMCGVIFAKLQRAGEPAAPVAVGKSIPEVNRLDGKARTALIIGTLLAIGAHCFTFPKIALQGLTTLVHEMGHAAAGWLFGCPSIPAFDLRYGGGVTTIQNRDDKLMWLVLVGILGLAFYFRKNLPALGLFIGAAVLYLICSYTVTYKIIIMFMGHGMELLIAGLFLYRALSGRSVFHELERIAYALVAVFILIQDVMFAWNLTFSANARMWYGRAKGGGHWMDFSQIAERYLHVGMPSVTFFFLLLCLVVPVAAVLLHRYQVAFYRLCDRLFDRD